MTPDRPLRDLLQLFGLFGFAVAGPLLDLLERGPEFLVAHGVAGGDLALLVAALLLPAPLACWLLERLLALISARLRAGLHLALIGALAAATWLRALVLLWPEVGAALLLPAAAGGGLVVCVAVQRRETARQIVAALALGPPVFAASFWLSTPIAPLRAPAAGTPAAASAAAGAPAAPVVWIVFDELPVTSLLDAGGGVDASRYPHFAALAGDAVWFRNTATVAETTAMAIPALLTGSLPAVDALPVAADHPRNLFTWLRATHDVHALETRTRLDPFSRDAGAAASPWGDGALLSDLAVLLAHVLAPADLAGRLPPVTRDWRGFAPGAAELAAWVDPDPRSGRGAAFERFIEGIGPCPRPCLQFAHVVLPHVPWNLLPSGRLYEPPVVYGIEAGEGRWRGDDAWVLQGYQRHLLQLAWVDRLLGRLVATLRSVGLYDAALIVVTADHGAAFWAGATRRLLADHPHPQDILRVPLFVKPPGPPRGEVRDVPISTIDVLPTVAELLGAPLPWPVDGVSAAAADFAGRPVRVAVGGDGRAYEYGPGALPIGPSLARKLDAFGSGDGEAGLYRAGRYGAIVGRGTAELALSAAAGARALIADEPFARAARTGRVVPARLFGIVSGARAPEPHAAIVGGGVVRAVGPTYPMGAGRRAFNLFVPESTAGSFRESPEVLLVTGPPDAPRLEPTAAALAPVLREFIDFEWRRPLPGGDAPASDLP